MSNGSVGAATLKELQEKPLDASSRQNGKGCHFAGDLDGDEEMTQEEDVLNLYDDDAQKLNEYHYKAQQAAKDSFNHGIEAGRILAEVKDGLPHGKFTVWVKARFEGSDRTARFYMRAHREVSTGAVPKADGSAWGYSLSRLVQAARKRDAEPEPEEPAAPREPAPPAAEADFEEEVEDEEYDFGSQEEYEKWDDEAQGGAAQEPEPREPEKKPERKPEKKPEKKPERKPERKHDLLEAAFNAIHRAVEEVEGEERAERIQAIIDRASLYKKTPVESKRRRSQRTKPVEGPEPEEAAPEEDEPMFKCPLCESLWDEEDLITFRECSNEQCGAVFDGSSGRNCEDCNRPSTRRLHSRGCPDCLSEEPCELNVPDEPTCIGPPRSAA